MSEEAFRFTWLEDGTVTSPRGFLAGAVYAGIKIAGHDKKDLGVLMSEAPCAVAGVFTTNRVAAAPVVLSRRRIQGGRPVRGIVFNSGNANAATGEEGLRAAHRMTEVTARRFGGTAEEYLVASTGVIGVPLPVDKVEAGMQRIILRAGAGHEIARCIMTTDTRPKEAALEVEGPAFSFRIGAIAKGAGMIHPNMATMFCFLATDAAVDREILDAALRRAADVSFNMISVDGDMSTNDTVIVLANGQAGTPTIAAGTAEADAFEHALTQLCIRMAKAIAADGEGATKLIEVVVDGAASADDARRAARAIASSNLVKTAVYGADPNWGRIACAAGYSGAELDESRLDITIGGIPTLRSGQVLSYDKGVASAALRRSEVRIEVNLNLGDHSATAWGCDLTEGYVRVNSSYTT